MPINLPRMAAQLPVLLPAFLLPALLLSAPALHAAEPGPLTLQEKLATAATIKAPVGALMTFHLIDNCVRMGRGEALPVYDETRGQLRPMTETEQRNRAADCAGLTPELAESRMDYLDRALKGGAEGAAAAFLAAGPAGDPDALRTRPNDPQVMAWKKQAVDYLAEAALRGDFTSLVHLHLQQGDPDRLGAPLALVYAADATLQRITQQNTAQAEPADPFAEAARRLDAEQLARAKSLSDTMLAAYNRQREGRRDPAPAAAAN